MKTKRVLYFHGFASSPKSQKVALFREILDSQAVELNVPDLNIPSFEKLDLDAILEFAEKECRRYRPDLIVGSSLGALFALALAQRGAGVPLVLIAPAIGVAERWHERLDGGDPVFVYNFSRDAHVPIHRKFFDQIASLHVDEFPPQVPVSIFMGRRDETVPYHYVEDIWSSWRKSGALDPRSKFVEFAAGDHSLTAYVDVIAAEIRRV